MPTVLRQDGFDVMIHTDDHEPPHVHCYGEDAVVVVELDPLWIRRRRGNDRDVRVAWNVVAQHRDFLRQKWSEIHGEE